MHEIHSAEVTCAFCRGKGETLGATCVACAGCGRVVQRTLGDGRAIQIVVEEPAQRPA